VCAAQVMFRYARTQLQLGISAVVDCPLAHRHLYDTASSIAHEVGRLRSAAALGACSCLLRGSLWATARAPTQPPRRRSRRRAPAAVRRRRRAAGLRRGRRGGVAAAAGGARCAGRRQRQGPQALELGGDAGHAGQVCGSGSVEGEGGGCAAGLLWVAPAWAAMGHAHRRKREARRSAAHLPAADTASPKAALRSPLAHERRGSCGRAAHGAAPPPPACCRPLQVRRLLALEQRRLHARGQAPAAGHHRRPAWAAAAAGAGIPAGARPG
jgi:hypothetical protein